MQVIKRTQKGYLQDPTKYFNFERFEKKTPDFVLIEGAFEEADQWTQFELSNERLNEIRQSKLVRLEFEEPNKFFIGDRTEKYDHEFHRIFTLCPYTAKWMNEKYQRQLRVPIFFPFNEEYIPPQQEKEFDVIYTGHLVSRELIEEIGKLAKFNYALISNSNHALVTHKAVSYDQKLALMAKSRVTLVHNILYPRNEHIAKIKKYNDWERNEAFREIAEAKSFLGFMLKRPLVPQLKSRVFEAAFSRSLILCKRDNFNVIENFFEEGREFIYYDNDLVGVLRNILNDFRNYEQVIENAYRRALENYTTAKFVDQYLMKI